MYHSDMARRFREQEQYFKLLAQQDDNPDKRETVLLVARTYARMRALHRVLAFTEYLLNGVMDLYRRVAIWRARISERAI